MCGCERCSGWWVSMVFCGFFGGQRVNELSPQEIPEAPLSLMFHKMLSSFPKYTGVMPSESAYGMPVAMPVARYGPWPVALSQLRFPMRFPMRIYATLASPCFQMLEWKHSIRKFLPPEAMDNPTPRLSPSADPSALRRCHSLAQKASSLCFWPPPQAQHALEFAEALVLSV